MGLYMKPDDIEAQSFAIISEMLGDRQFPPDMESIVKRCIHTSADFDYADTLYCSPGAVDAIKKALGAKACIVTDTQMVKSGINRKAAEKLGVEVLCFMTDAYVAAQAEARGQTRAVVAMEKAITLDKSINRPFIFAVGNAPTALLCLHQAMQDGYRPAGIIAVPVGFVNVVESKELIMASSASCIVARGRKGGSTIAAAICNALLYDLAGRE